jgi:signal transduction histidine kinase/CheY-like chemotaxis protein
VAYLFLNIDHSVCCYFFPLLMGYQILFDLRTEWKRFLVTVSVTLLFAIGCFVLPKGAWYYYEMPPELIERSRLTNFILPLVIAIIFLIIIMRMYIAAQNKLIEAKEEAEASYKTKSTFLSNMSHELRTPLNGIIGSVHLLQNEQITSSQKRYFDIIQYSSNHMLSLVNDILDFSKIEAGKLELDKNVFNVREVVDRVANMFLSQPNRADVLFKVDVDGNLDRVVTGDDLRLSQVLHNLLSNAFKFTRRGSVLLKATMNNDVDGQLVVDFSVTDTGVGIKKEVQVAIFESFTQADSGTTRKYGGTGLGLTISKELVEKMGGKISMESMHGKGSRFSFTISFSTQVQVLKQAELEMPPMEMNNLQNMKILVAEDNPVNMLLLRNFLKKWNALVTEVKNGQEAVLYHQRENFDLILLDLEMPVMDGYTAINEIRKSDHKIPILAFTAALYDGMSIDLLNRGFNGYLHKPFKPQELFSKINPFKPAAPSVL